MQLGLGNQLVVNPVNSVPLGERPTLGISFDRSRYTNPAGFANQAAVGSADFKLQSYAGPSPTFTRATAATFRGSNGLIQYAPENLLIYSEEFNTSWQKIGAQQIVSNAVVAPNGTQSADKLCASSVSELQSIFQSYTFANTRYTISISAKSAEYSWLFIRIDGVTNGYVWFNLNNGTIGTTAANRTPTISSQGNGWYRCTVSWTSNGGSGNVLIGGSNADNTYIFAGNSTSGIYIWGAQLERSSTARPYISTTTTPRYGPRFEYDLNGNPLGLLMEEQSENKLSYSEQFNDLAWTKSNLNVTGNPAWVNVALAPNGTQTADKIIENSFNTSHLVYQQPSTQQGSNYCLSVYLKAAERTSAAIQLLDTGLSDNRYSVLVDLLTGYVLDVRTRGTPIGTSYSIANAGNGWFRISITITKTQSGTSGLFALVALSNSNSPTWDSQPYPVYQGNDTSGIYIWGAQLEQKPFATSYIPTVASSVVRNADLCTVSGSDFTSGWFNTEQGTIVCKGNRYAVGANGDSIVEFFSAFSVSPVVLHFTDTSISTEYGFFRMADYSTEVYIPISTYSPTEPAVRFAATYQESPYNLYTTSFNGNIPLEDYTSQALYTPDELHIGRSQGASTFFNGHLTDFSYTKTALPADIQTITNNP